MPTSERQESRWASKNVCGDSWRKSAGSQYFSFVKFQNCVGLLHIVGD